MRSMTGFGKSEGNYRDTLFFTVEISSVNRKQLEVRCSLPPELSGMESSRRERMYRILCVVGLQPHLGAWWAWAMAPRALGCCRPVLSILDV